MHSVIWIVPKPPLPAFDGARIATAVLLSELAALGVQIHLLIIDTEGHSQAAAELQRTLGVASVEYLRTSSVGEQLISSPRLQSLLLSLRRPFLGLTMQRHANKHIQVRTRELLDQIPCDTVVFDTLHSAAAFTSWTGLLRKFAATRIFYRAHNREFRIWQRKVESLSNPLIKLFFRYQAALIRRCENSLVRGATTTFTVSKEDIADFQQDTPGAQYSVVPIGSDFSRPIAELTASGRIFFVGRLDWPPNAEGLRWFLERVWPAVHQKRPDYSLDIVGSGRGEWLKAYQSLPGIRMHGRVEDIDVFYDNAMLCIIPVFFGSGTRVKAIEAARFGRPCISSAVGVEGLPLEPGKDFVLAETDQDWIEAITSVDTERLRSIGHSAHQKLSMRFDKKHSAELLASGIWGEDSRAALERTSATA